MYDPRDNDVAALRGYLLHSIKNDIDQLASLDANEELWSVWDYVLGKVQLEAANKQEALDANAT